MDIGPVKKVDLSTMRAPYVPDENQRDFSVKNPLKLFDIWFAEARNTPEIIEANAMALATADRTGKPSVRMVLLKSYSKEGFVFFTNYNSKKGRDIAENPYASLLFYWAPLFRQVRIEGQVVKISEKESAEYFDSRPRSSRLSAIVSNQSESIESKEILVQKMELLEAKYADASVLIPKPDYWGGYLVMPTSFEFWCGQSNRLHDRIRFRKPESEESISNVIHNGEDGWIYEYLSP